MIPTTPTSTCSGRNTRRRHRRLVGVATLAATLLGVASSAAADPGQIDSGFGTNGKRVVSYGEQGDTVSSEPVDAVRMNRGRIAVGFVEERAGAQHGIVRMYAADGSDAGNFGVGGEIDLGPNTEVAALARVGRRLVVAGTVIEPLSAQRWVQVWKFTSTGRLDDSFSADGIADPTGDHSGSHNAVDVVVDGDKRIVVVATGNSVGAEVYRLLPNGENDTSFGGDGLVTDLMFGSANNFPRALATDSQGRVVIAASALLDVDDGQLAIGVIVGRLTEAGEWDTTLSGDGQKVYGQGLSRQVEPADVAVDARGRIVVVGTASVYPADPRPQAFALRLRPGGRMDQSFSGDGFRAFRFDGSGAAGRTVTLLEGNRLLVGGEASGLLGMAVLRGDGRFDSSFSGDGTRTLRFGPSTSTLVSTVPDKNVTQVVLVGGYDGVEGGLGMAAVRLR